MNRREFLKNSVSLATLSVAAGDNNQMGGKTANEILAEYEPPEHVTLEFDEQELRTYRPWLDLSALVVKPFGLFGMKATSPEYDLDAYVYACKYTHQQGFLAPPLGDSHWGDTEWLQVFVDQQDEVSDVVYTIHHWSVGRRSEDNIPLYDETHPIAHVSRKWHNYVLNGNVTGSFDTTLRDMTDPNSGFEHWIVDKDMHEHLRPGCVRVPWNMFNRDHFWRSGFDARYASIFTNILQPVIG